MSAAPAAIRALASFSPAAAAAPRLPRTDARTTRPPSSDVTTPGDVDRLSIDTSEHAEWQLTAAAKGLNDGAFGDQRIPGVRVAQTRHHIPHLARRIVCDLDGDDPWPGAGTMISTGISAEIRAARPSRTRPAAASTRAEQSPASSLRSRVSTLPRIGRRPPPETPRAVPRSAERCWCRSSRRRRVQRSPRPIRVPCSSRAARSRRVDPRVAASPPAEGRRAATAGRSLLLCTARSMRLSRSASSISFTNRRLTAIGSGAAASGGRDDRCCPRRPTCESPRARSAVLRRRR